MNQEVDQSAVRCARRSRPVFGILTAALLLGGCSAVPDWADPTDWFAEDAAPTKVGLAEGQARTQPTAFPNLASVPDKAPKVMSAEARATVKEDLAADRANAVYSGEKLVGAAPSGPARGAATSESPTTSGAPPIPKISASLSPDAPARPVPPAPVQAPVAQAQTAPAPMAQAPMAPTQMAQAAGGKTQLRFRQFETPQTSAAVIPPGPTPAAPAGTPSVAAVPPAVGAQLVAVIYFAHGSSRIDDNDRSVLRDIVALHRQHGGRIRVVGHASAHTQVADQITHNLANFEMSLKRANAVAAALVSLGVARDEVRAEARGDNQPVYHEFMPTGQAGNRRAEIFLEY